MCQPRIGHDLYPSFIQCCLTYAVEKSSLNTNRIDWCRGTALDSYSGGARFESWLGSRLSCLRFSWFTSLLPCECWDSATISQIASFHLLLLLARQPPPPHTASTGFGGFFNIFFGVGFLAPRQTVQPVGHILCSHSYIVLPFDGM
jgi:hypothetical protein